MREASPPAPPGPAKTRPWSLAHVRNLRRYVRDPLAFVAGRFASYGDVYLVHTGGERLFVFKHPEHLAAILQVQADAFRKRDIGLERILGRGLLTSDGELWKQRRRAIQPGFSKAHVARYGAIMVEHAEQLAGCWRADQRIDIDRAMTSLTLAIVARCLFSHRISDTRDRVAAAMRAFQDSFGTFDPLPAWLPTPRHLRARRAQAELDALVFELIAKRRATRAHTGAGEGDLLDGLLDALVSGDVGAAMSDGDRQALRDELVTLYLAGHDTTAHALSWAWLLLARHPDIDARLADELRTVLGERAASVDDLEHLPYLRAVCHEVLRLYPPAYVLARRALREVEIGEWTVPAGSPVVMWIYMTHHDPRWWPEPERFDPTRFLAPHDDRHKLAWLPFGAGARMCVGKHFALLEMQLLLASLLRRFRFELDPIDVAAKPRITLAPARAMSGHLRLR